MKNDAPAAAGSGRRFRSFKTKLMWLVALAVSVPALSTCLFLGYQLDRQARTLFANGLRANLETFSLVLAGVEQNLFDGARRAAADNTLQITLDLEIGAQLTKYIESQRQVMSIDSLVVYGKDSKPVAASSSGQTDAQWRLSEHPASTGADCVASREADQQIVTCKGIAYLVSVVPVFRAHDANLGDATAPSAQDALIGYLLGATPIANPALVTSLQNRHIAHPLIWFDNRLVYANIPAAALSSPRVTDGSASEYNVDNTAYLGAAKTESVGAHRLVYAVVAPLAPLQTALLRSLLTVAGIGLFLVVATLMAASLVANRLLQPIEQLRVGAARIGSGDLGQRITISTGDEVEALADQFNDMAGRLQESYAGLERKVEARTSELTESLQQQTATSEVLRVISSSPGELPPVFQSMLQNATRLCGANFGLLSLSEGDAFRIGAMHNMPPGFIEHFQRAPTFRPGPLAPLTRAAATKDVVHIVDLSEDPAYKERDPPVVSLVELGGVRSILVVPMLKEGELIGALGIYGRDVRPFTDKQIELVKNFAAQAVIAIENTRLLTELRQRTDELGRSVAELRALGEVSQAVNSTLDLETVLATIVAKAVQLSNTDAGAIYVFDELQREFHLRATYGMSQEMTDVLTQRHVGLDESNVTLALTQHGPAQIADLREQPASAVNEIILRAGYRALLVAPLLRGEEIVGMLVVRRRTPGAFAQNTVDLIKTFAAQSVLAIQNARLFQEIGDKSRELEIASQHKSQFLANMSHELRTPLNAVIGYSEILQEEVADLGQEQLIPDLKKIEGAGRHLLGLINDILDLSKVEAGKMDVFLEDVELGPLLEEVRALIVPLAEKNGNTLEMRPADALGSIRTDRTKLKQSLLNILSNGSKFTQNGRLILVAERFTEGADRPMVRFAISDTGIGMTEEQLGRLFQAFSQADASTTKKYGGTGLGLAISRRFCQLLGGDISVASRPGEGSTFTITLPAASEEPAQIKPAEAPRLAADANNGPTVLIVDDDAAARDLLATNLKGAGYRLVHAASGAEALAIARTMRPDAITLDVMMPKPDGWDVLSALKADAELRDIPVVMVTVVPERGIGLSLGAVDVLTKPVDRAQLTALIHRLIRREGPVLVVEDDADTRAMMRHAIGKMGLAVAEASDGGRALAWLGDHGAPAAILLDLMMPEMDGFAFLDAFSVHAEWRDIPVVVITAKQLTAAERERLLGQVRKVMEKATASRIDIAAAISEAVRRRPAAAAPTAAESERVGQE